jgi:tRNA A22 N-methylase
MMVQRLLILLVKNNNMKCAIALDINEGKYPATVELGRKLSPQIQLP